MTTHTHQLSGCAPTPLAWYLKGLAVLKLVGEQADPSARAYWKDECLWLSTKLDRQALEAFFLHQYQPTPLIAPWNGGSGFYPKDNQDGIAPLTQSTAARLSSYRAAIAAGKAMVGNATERPEKQAKEDLLRKCRHEWRGTLGQWFEAAVVLVGDGGAQYPALLGTGGNDGRLDFTNNFMQRLTEILDPLDPEARGRPDAQGQLQGALWGTPVPGLPSKRAVGQFFPGAAGGANGTNGFSAESLSNAWDFILMLEGAVLFASSAVRRMESKEPVQASAPFAVRAGAAGYGTATASEEGARGEQWMPLWDQAATLKEVRHVIAEGRLQLPKSQIRRPTDVARAIARLGVSRGISAFQRFGYIERNGQANLATPLGRWPVVFRPEVQLLDDVERWVDDARMALRENAPATLRAALRNLDEAILACTRGASTPPTWQKLLIALGSLEHGFVGSPRLAADKGIKPLRLTNPDRIRLANDGSAEFRLALAFAGQHDGKGFSIREHFLPVDGSGRAFLASDSSLRLGPDIVCKGRNLEKDALALLQRRIVHSQRGPRKEGKALGESSHDEDDQAGALPLHGRPPGFASPGDVAAFLGRETDDAYILSLAKGLMALDWARVSTPGRALPQENVPAVYALFRLTHLPWKTLKVEHAADNAAKVEIRLDPAIFARLAGGDLQGAAQVALRRLRASGLRPKMTLATGDSAFARRLAASLAFPIGMGTALDLLKLVTHPEKNEPTELEKLEEAQCLSN